MSIRRFAFCISANENEMFQGDLGHFFSSLKIHNFMAFWKNDLAELYVSGHFTLGNNSK